MDEFSVTARRDIVGTLPAVGAVAAVEVARFPMPFAQTMIVHAVDEHDEWVDLVFRSIPPSLEVASADPAFFLRLGWESP